MSGAEEREARSVALERAYVHEVYEQISGTRFPPGASADSQRGRAWPKVKQFLSELEPGSLVCDIGCGSGKYLNVNPLVFKIGADRCNALTETAREKEHEVLLCDNLSLPFRDDSFDAVLSVAVIHHFATTERRVGALRELARVLRIGGRLIISVWAMKQRHRKFESQDVLVPWHRPQHLSTPSLELTSTTTTTSEDDGPPPYHAYTQTSDSDSCRSARPGAGQRKRGRSRHKGRSIDPARPCSSSQSSSSLSSPNETCYSFVRRALQKLAGGKRGGSGHRPWFLESWSSCTKEPPPPHRYDPEGCEDGEGDGEDIQDLPIELRRLEEEQHDPPQRRQTFACARRATPHEVILNHKSKSLSDILTVGQRAMVRSRSSVPSLGVGSEHSTATGAPAATAPTASNANSSSKPKLVKQKKSLCEEEMEEEGDLRDLVKALPEFKVSGHGGGRRYANVFKQSSMNEELMSAERLREKERLRQNIQKQASLNEELIYRRHRTLDSLRDTIFSTSTAKRFQLLKNGLTSKLKSSTTGIEKVAGSSFKNGFVRILQGWKGSDVSYSTRPSPSPTPSEAMPPCTPPPDSKKPSNNSCTGDDNNKKEAGRSGSERRHSREDGSDSSKDSSLQSDTSVDSEDSFASVIFVPKPDPTATQMASPPKSPQPTSPKVKQQLTSPQMKLSPPALSSRTPLIEETPLKEEEEDEEEADDEGQELPAADEVELSAAESRHSERLRQIQELLRSRAAAPVTGRITGGAAVRNPFPLVRRSSAMVLGRPESLARPLPRLLSLELFNPETDDMDSDSSGVSSPDSVSSVISVLTEEPPQLVTSTSTTVPALQDSLEPPAEGPSTPTESASSPSSLPPQATVSSPKAPDIVTEQLLLQVQDTESSECLTTEQAPRASPSSLSLLEAAADVASSLEDAVDAVIQSSPRARRRKLELLDKDPMSMLQDGCYSGSSSSSSSWSLHKSDSSGKLYPGNSSDWNLHKPTSSVFDARNSKFPRSVGRSPGDSRIEGRYGEEQQEDTWDEDCRQHLADFAEKLSEKLLEEIEQYRKQASGQLPQHDEVFAGWEHFDDPYLSRLSDELQDLTKLSEELQERNSYLASLNDAAFLEEMQSQSLSTHDPLKVTASDDPFLETPRHSDTTVEPKPEPDLAVSSESTDELSGVSDVVRACNSCSGQTSDVTETLDTCVQVLSKDDEEQTCEVADVPTARHILTSTAGSVMSLRPDYPTEASDAGDMAGSGCSRGETKSPDKMASSASLGPNCTEFSDAVTGSGRDTRNADKRTVACDGRSSSEETPARGMALKVATQEPPETLTKTESCTSSLSGSTSQESLPSDNGGGAITFHRYYHVFREGELDQLIERYVENLHIISSYYDHANWCVVAEKVHVWTI